MVTRLNLNCLPLQNLMTSIGKTWKFQTIIEENKSEIHIF